MTKGPLGFLLRRRQNRRLEITSLPAGQPKRQINLAQTRRRTTEVGGLREETMNPSAEKQREPDPGDTVLLVDEDSEYLEHIRRVTQGMGYNIHACNSYAEGIRQLESRAFEFIIVGQGSHSF